MSAENMLHDHVADLMTIGRIPHEYTNIFSKVKRLGLKIENKNRRVVKNHDHPSVETSRCMGI